METRLDNDLYKFTMMQWAWKHAPEARARYALRVRSAVNLFSFRQDIEAWLEQWPSCRFCEEEIAYLRTLGYFEEAFLELLQTFSWTRPTVHWQSQQGVLFLEGIWWQIITLEVPLLAFFNSCYYQAHAEYAQALCEAHRRWQEKEHFLAKATTGFKITDFGTRRRLSYAFHKALLQQWKDHVPQTLAGTSNLALARHFDLPVVGTMAHEYLQAFQVLAPALESFQKTALQAWYAMYGTPLAIALTDVISLETFLQDFAGDLASCYRGVRQDSGDPEIFMEKVLDFYQKHGIPASSKHVVFSDGLTVQKAYALYQKYHPKMHMHFGIGTDLLCDTFLAPTQAVMKLVALNDHPVAKLSDSPEKSRGFDEAWLQTLRACFIRV